MPLSDIINLTINLEPAPIPRAGFGIPLLLGVLPAVAVTAMIALPGSPLTVELTPATFKTTLASLGLVSSDEIFRMFVALFGDDTRQPTIALLGRRATPVAQVRTVTVNTAEAGTYTVTINGDDAVFVAVAEAVTAIRDALVTAINALTQPVTATPASTDEIVLTADEAGESSTLAVTHSATPANITFVVTTPNVGVQEDFAAIKLERDDWYATLLLERTSGQIREASSFIETENKIYIAQTDDSTAQAASTTDIGAELNALARVRTAVVFNDDDLEYVDAAWAGRMLPSDPGSETWAFQRLRGVTGFIPTSSTNLASKKYNWLESFVSGSFSMMAGGFLAGAGFGGTMADGTFIDLVRGRDFLQNELEIALLELLRDEPKIPYTSAGGTQIEGVIQGVLEDGVTQGIIAPNTAVVTIPVPEDQSSTDKGNRFLDNITWGATLQGAIHSMEITGNLAA